MLAPGFGRGYTPAMNRRPSSRERLRTAAVVATIAIVVLGLVLSSFQTY